MIKALQIKCDNYAKISLSSTTKVVLLFIARTYGRHSSEVETVFMLGIIGDRKTFSKRDPSIIVEKLLWLVSKWPEELV